MVISLVVVTSFIFSSGCFFTNGQSGTDDSIDKSQFQLDLNKSYKIEFMMWGAKDEIDNYTALVNKFMDEYKNITVRSDILKPKLTPTVQIAQFLIPSLPLLKRWFCVATKSS